MPLQQTTTGLQIQDIAEIKSEFEADFRELFGADVSVGPESVFGKQIGTMSEREALIQALAQRIQAEFSRIAAQAANLDAVSALTGSHRRGASQSKSSAGKAFGTDGVIVLNGSTVVQQNDALDVWTVVDGVDGVAPFGYEIGTTTTGEIEGVVIQSVNTGAKVFVSATEFVIGTPIAGWNSFAITRDIETYETGQDVETDAEFRDRGRDELFAGGNDTSGIKAVITKVPGVSEVQVFENRNCQVVDENGIEPGHLESVVTGGDDLAVATAILSRVPPGTSLQGTTEIILADTEGNDIPIRFTRPALVEITVDIIIHNLNAEGTMPENFEALIEQAVLDFGNANSRVSQDVLYQQFIGPAASQMQDSFTGKFNYDFIESKISTGGATTAANISIGIRERADYDSARITAQLA
jgi:hypothetical protein